MIATYDLGAERPTYDFCPWLARVSQEGYDAVSLKPGPAEGFQPEPHPPADPAARRFMFENVMIPAVPRFGLALVSGEGEIVRGSDLRFVVDGWNAGRRFARPAPSRAALRMVSGWLPDRYVTITLRESPKHPARNSNRQTWDAVAARLADIVDVVVIPDTDRAAEPGTAGWAATNLDLRLAAYAGARLNLGVNNGPTGVLWLSEAPYLTAKPVTESVSATTARHLLDRVGIAPGIGLPWATGRQAILWRDDDDPDPIVAAARDML